MQRLWPCLAWSCFPPSNFGPCGLLEVKVSGWDVPAAPKAKSQIPLHVMNEKDPALSWDVIGSGWFGSCTSGPKISQRRQSNPSSQVDLCYTETWPVSFAASDCSEWKNVFNEYGHSWNFAGYTHHCSFVEGTSTQLSHHWISTTWGGQLQARNHLSFLRCSNAGHTHKASQAHWRCTTFPRYAACSSLIVATTISSDSLCKTHGSMPSCVSICQDHLDET